MPRTARRQTTVEPFRSALGMAISTRQSEICSHLVKAGASVNLVSTQQDAEGQPEEVTPLYAAAVAGDAALVSLLIAANAEVRAMSMTHRF